MRSIRFYFIACIIVLIDQSVKFWVKTHMRVGQEISVAGKFFKIHFIENPGMAFGLSFRGEKGKLFLTIFSIIAVGALAYYLYRASRQHKYLGLCVSLILGGAIGNIFDRVFYGVLFSESTYGYVAEFLPKDGGYASLLNGKVVDMFYLDIWRGNIPSWIPFIGGDYTALWPIFNVADASICVGVISILIFQKKFFSHHHPRITETKV